MKLLRQILLAGILCLTFTAHAELDKWDKVDRFGFIYGPISKSGLKKSMCKGVSSEGPQSGDIVIPETGSYGYVVAIGTDAFRDNHDYTSVTFPWTLSRIMENAFSNCSGLTSIVFNCGYYPFDDYIYIGEGAFSGCSGLTSLDLTPLDLSEFTRPIDIDDNAFSGCTGLTNIVMAQNITIIGEGAFSGTSITSVTIPDLVVSLGGFENCPNLTTAVLPKGLQKFFPNAFRGCPSLTSIIILEGITEIPSNAFRDCTSLTSVTLPSTLTSLGESAFAGNSGLTAIVIPEGVTEIGANALSNCASLASVTLPSTLTSLGESAFAGNSGLTAIVIPEGVTEIGANALSNCASLTSVTLPSTLTSLGEGAFTGCTSLTSITIPEGVTSLPSGAFRDCTSLAAVNLPSTLTSLGEGAFAGNSGLTAIVIPEGVTEIGANALSNCASLTSVTLPSTLTTLGEGTFIDCPKLASITLAEGTSEILAGAFSNCTSLTSIPLPASVAKIGAGAFSGCHGLTDVSIPETVTTIGNAAFRDCRNLKTLTIENSATPLTFDTEDAENPIAPFAESPIETLYLGRNLDWTASQDVVYAPFSTLSTLRTITFGPETDRIKENTFLGCSSLGADFTIPGTVRYIGVFAFKGCTGIKNLRFENGEPDLELAFDNAGNGCFNGCPIKSIHLDRNISLGSGTSGGPICDPANLKTLLFGENVSAVPTSAFSGCTGLTSLDFGANLATIGTSAFSGCSGLKELTIGANLATIEASAFKGCSGIKSLRFESGEADLELSFDNNGNGCFNGCPIESIYLDRNISFGSGTSGGPICDPANLKTLLFGENVSAVPASAFSGCTGLTLLDFGANLATIGASAFSGCSGLTSVILPPTVNSVGDEPFKDCSGLIKSAYPDKLKNPFSNGVAIAYSSDSYLFTDDGYIYNADKSRLYFVPMNTGETFEIDGSVKAFGITAFYGCTNIKNLVIKENPDKLTCEYSDKLQLPESIESLHLGRDIEPLNQRYTLSPFAATLKHVMISNNVTTISNALFRGCHISSIDIPESVRSIGKWVFAQTDLEKIIIPDGIESLGDAIFQGCKSLTEGILPKGLTEIPKSTFYGCLNLEKINIPEGVTIIGSSAFRRTALNNIQLPQNLKTIEGDAFANTPLTEISLPEGLTLIGEAVFSGCALEKISIPGSVSTLGPQVFANNKVPTSVAFEDGASILNVNNNVFENTEITSVYISRPLNEDFTLRYRQSLISATLTDKVLNIPSSMFMDCRNLASVTLSKRHETIGASAFARCYALEEILIPESVTFIGNYAFLDCTSLQGIEIPEGIGVLSTSVFAGCTALKSVSLPSSLTTISDEAFINCESLEHLNIPAEVRTIGRNAFKNTGLTEVRLPGKLEKIGATAFTGCSNLSEVYSLNPIPPLIDSSTFDATTEANAILMVPEDVRMYYAVDHVWREFKNISGYSNIMEAIPAATYGDGDINLDEYAPAGFHFVYTADNDDVVEIQGSTMRIIGAGETTITATTTDGSDSGVTGLVRRFVVNKANLTVSVKDMTIVEGTELPPFEYITVGFVNDDTIDDIEQLPVPECGYTVTSPAGVYPVRLVGGRDRNYNFITEEATVKVTGDSGIDDIESDLSSEPVYVFNLNGVLLYNGPRDEMRLQNGMYIIRQGSKTAKLHVK